MKKGNTLYVEGNSPLKGYYTVILGKKDLFKLEKLDGEYQGVPTYKGKVVVPRNDPSIVEERTCAKIVLEKKKSLTGMLFKAPSCANFKERHFLELKNGSSRKK